MNLAVVQRILGLLLMMFSLTMLPPIGFSLYYDDHSWLPFVEGFGITLLAGLLLWLPVHRVRKELRFATASWSLPLSGRFSVPPAPRRCYLQTTFYR